MYGIYCHLVLFWMTSFSSEAFTPILPKVTKSSQQHIISTTNLSSSHQSLDETNTPKTVKDTTATNQERRLFFQYACSLVGLSTLTTSTTLLSFPDMVQAYPQEKSDKENIVKGYKRLQYLIDNWEKETTVCGRTDNPYIGCERTPEKVMEYLGFKSTNDPLFRADKTLLRLQDLVKNDDEIDFIDAMEKFNEASEEGSGIAYVSSWGEANPGGGKDRIELFIERSRKSLVTSCDSLYTIIKILDLKLD